jgi:small subunit ribosomal protein S6
VREYELVYIIQPDAPPEKEKDLRTRIDGFVSRAEGITLLWDDWGKRKLSYEINKFQKGHYVFGSFLGAGPAIPEIERLLRLDSDVLRFLTVKVSDRVADVEARVAEARKEEAERAKRREEREKLEAERAAREAELTATAASNGAARESLADQPDEEDLGSDESESDDVDPVDTPKVEE